MSMSIPDGLMSVEQFIIVGPGQREAHTTSRRLSRERLRARSLSFSEETVEFFDRGVDVLEVEHD
jgi:hypothetical protein